MIVRGFVIKKVGKIANHPSRFELYNTLKFFGSENFRNDPGALGRVSGLTKVREICFSSGISASKKEGKSNR
jgi:hypothetical protein